jgi:glutamyl-tRNA synthetase
VPLVVNADGARLAKRDGAVTLADLASAGVPADAVRRTILDSLGLPGASLDSALSEFDPAALPRQPWIWPGM